MIAISVQTFVMLIIGVVLGFYYDWRLSLINLGFFPLIMFNSVMHFKIQSGYTNADQKTEIEAGSILSESVINTKTIFSYNMQSTVVNLYKEILDRKSKDLVCQSIINGVLFGISQFVVFIIYAVLFYAGGQFMLKGYLTLKSMMSAIFAILMSAFGLGMAQQYIKDYSESRTALMNLTRVLDEKTEIDPYEEGKIEADKIDFQGEIEFDNVTFSYPTMKNRIVMSGLSFKIPAGHSVAFVGKSGCGKSTIIQLLERFYDVNSGEIKVSGKNIKEFDLISYRKKVGLVMQEPILFKRPLKDNIRYGKPDATDEEIMSASKLAKIDDLVRDGDNKSITSGGQKQRIAIARAIIKSPAILLLDEATSALDSENEKIVQEALDQVMLGRTSIIIAHR
jgi:ATP-binding cassette subfamily B (MDR/TAP) protein 1